MTQEALKLVMDALDDLLYWDNGKPEYDEARKALQVGKEALAKTQEPDVQETLHWHAFNYRQAHTAQAHEMWQQLEQFVDSKIKAPQRTWVGLTDEDMKGMSYGDKVLAAWVARTLKEKNT
jgi:hypothetical protein